MAGPVVRSVRPAPTSAKRALPIARSSRVANHASIHRRTPSRRRWWARQLSSRTETLPAAHHRRRRSWPACRTNRPSLLDVATPVINSSAQQRNTVERGSSVASTRYVNKCAACASRLKARRSERLVCLFMVMLPRGPWCRSSRRRRAWSWSRLKRQHHRRRLRICAAIARSTPSSHIAGAARRAARNFPDEARVWTLNDG